MRLFLLGKTFFGMQYHILLANNVIVPVFDKMFFSDEWDMSLKSLTAYNYNPTQENLASPPLNHQMSQIIQDWYP